MTKVRAETGEIIPHYRLELLLESSPKGEIYRAVNTVLNKTFLVKIIAPESFDENAKSRFLTETRSLSAIIHQNIARVFDSGTLADGALYVVTEYFPAQTLRDCLTNVGLPSEVTALTITRQAAEGLEALHAVGVLHRGLRPENIILTADAENRFQIKLQNIDFGGIGQAIASAAPDLYISDFRYFSPEQCAAEETDAPTDIYALGVVLYETIAGRVPFDSPYADGVIDKQINEPPPPVKVKSFDLRMLLTHTLTDALQKTARTRLKSANAFARRIRHIEQLATHSPTPPPAMAYPATMNKAAVVFTPPAKAVEPVLETALPAENQAAVVEALPVIEEPAASPESFSIEAPAVDAAPVLTEPPTPAEIPVTEEISIKPEIPVAGAQPILGEPLVAAETALDNPIFETETALENPIAAPPVEDLVPAAPPATADCVSSLVTQPLDEELIAVEAAPAADSVLVEAAPPLEDLPAVDAHSATEELAPVEELPAAARETAIETAPAGEIETETESSEPFVYPDLSTTKLPPLDSIVENPLPAAGFEVRPVTAFEPRIEESDIHKNGEPVLIEWEQPDDVPTTTQALGKKRKAIKEIADAAFVPVAEPAREDDRIIEAGEIDAPLETTPKVSESRRAAVAERAVFSYDDSGTSWNLPDKRKLLAGGGVLALIVLAVGGTLLGRQFQSSQDTRQTAAQSTPAGKTLPKSAEPENKPAAKPEAVTINNPAPAAETSDLPGLPDYQPRAESEEKPVASIAPNRLKKQRALKEAPENRAAATPAKPATTAVFDKQGNKKTVKSQISTTGKTDGSTRPRIVQTPKF